MSSPVTTLHAGGSGTVARFTDDLIASKLLTMGVLPGSSVRVMSVAPFNGGYYLQVDGTGMALRNEEAHCIILETAG